MSSTVEVPKKRRSRKLTNSLTKRQLEVLKLISQGFTNREIGERLEISTGTVENHVQKTMQRLGVRTRTKAAAIYYRERG